MNKEVKHKCVEAWNRYCKKLGNTSVADVIPAQIFLDAFMYGYRCGKRARRTALRSAPLRRLAAWDGKRWIEVIERHEPKS